MKSILAMTTGTSAAFAQATTTETTTTRVEKHRVIELTPEQKTVIHRSITRDHAAAAPNVRVKVGEHVPSSVTLQSFPETVVVEAPTLKRYKYFNLQDRVVLVDPETDEVVDIVE
jgi:hypothetical protein